ncbi:MAG: origin recognition complex subunit 1 [Amphiamblys sp. WSBS2006]|nr:MAG: origin recognition complex subunit 1 [Amphiamblys sp. WSBS2006]
MDGPLQYREDEFSELQSVLTDALEARRGTSVYVSGMPGTGKTETVRRVVTALSSHNPGLAVLEINGAEKRNTRIVSVLCRLLGTTEARLQASLSKAPCVVVVDEIDFFSAKKELYMLFDLSCRCALCVVSIANTLELTPRLFSTRILSRMGTRRICFRPYSHVEIQGILGDRGKVCEFFSRKASAVTGDARRALQLWGAFKERATPGSSLGSTLGELDAFLLPRSQPLVSSCGERAIVSFLEGIEGTATFTSIDRALKEKHAQRGDFSWTFEMTLCCLYTLSRKGSVSHRPISVPLPGTICTLTDR